MMKATAPVPSNYDRFGKKVRIWPDLVSFLATPTWADGVHAAKLANGLTIELRLVNNPFGAGATGSLPIFFSGAVGTREGSSPPYFSGMTFANTLKTPAILISDPTLNIGPDLILGWYTGTAEQPARAGIAAILDEISARAGRDLLLIGGSGGGFAALDLIRHLGDKASAFVWNPQTDFLDYNQKFVAQHLRVALGPEFDDTDGPEVWKLEAAAQLRGHGIEHRLDGSTAARVFYLQNDTDWHLDAHALPFAERNGYADRGDGTHFNDAGHLIVVSNFGEGHAVPSQPLLHRALRLMFDAERSAESILSTLIDEGLLPPLKSTSQSGNTVGRRLRSAFGRRPWQSLRPGRPPAP